LRRARSRFSGKLAEKLVLKRNEREADMAMENVKEKMEG
jgi:hypothetical protein